MRKLKKKVGIVMLASVVGLTSTSFATPYTIKEGDSFWKVSWQYNVSLEDMLKENKANKNTVIYPGQIIQIPGKEEVKISSRGGIKRDVPDLTEYTVVDGDNIWDICKKYGVTIESIFEANKGIDENTVLKVGQKLNIAKQNKEQQNISEGSKKDETKVSSQNVNESVEKPSNQKIDTEGKYGEYLDWSKVDGLIPRGTKFKVIDFYTGKSFMVQRSVGSLHADCETLSLEDTNIMKDIWGGFSWVRRPVLVQIGDRLIAASATAMPHAGNDKAEGGAYTTWRSGGYGKGINFDYVKGNGMDGHFDIHFLGSKRHMDGQTDPQHQQCVKIAAGLNK
ncbi:MAG: LysM peptidoglycan-binding domain-containing protein [Tissierellaceae bacterium]|nr:LysM peptidoglycan-binding domain-containing protein [Tissierellaceae bacterium]